MSSENTVPPVWQHPETTSENTEPDQRRRPGATSITLSDAHRQVLAGYLAVLARAPLSAETVRTYTSKVRQYLAWLAIAEPDGDPMAQAQARDWAVRDYRSHLLGDLKRKPATINNALAAIDDFYTRLGLGPANAARLDLPDQAPKEGRYRTHVHVLDRSGPPVITRRLPDRSAPRRPGTGDRLRELVHGGWGGRGCPRRCPGRERHRVRARSVGCPSATRDPVRPGKAQDRKVSGE